MLSSYSRRLHREGAFSLSELIVVIFIMGVVTAIAVPSFIMQRKNSIDTQVKSDIVAANNVIEAWIIRHPSRKIPSGTIEVKKVNPDGKVEELKVDDSLENQGLKGFKISNHDTTLTITGNTKPLGTYTIVGVNERGNSSSPDSNGMVYDSSKEGFQ